MKRTIMYSHDIPDTARDINKFYRDNVSCYGLIKGGILDRLGVSSIFRGVWNGHGKPYSLTCEFSKENVNGRREKLSLALITLSQTGTTIEVLGNLFTNNEVYELASALDRELMKYEFIPTAYELWSDLPEVPFYISENPKKSGCSIVVVRDETKVVEK